MKEGREEVSDLVERYREFTAPHWWAVVIHSPQDQDEYREGEPEWAPDDQVSYEIQVKVQGVRLLVNWLTGLKSEWDHYGSPVLRLLDTVLAHDGDLQGEDNVRCVCVCVYVCMSSVF